MFRFFALAGFLGRRRDGVLVKQSKLLSCFAKLSLFTVGINTHAHTHILHSMNRKCSIWHILYEDDVGGVVIVNNHLRRTFFFFFSEFSS